MSKTWKIVSIISASILLIVVSGFVFYFLYPWNKEFFYNASEEFEIPGLDEDFCPQGITKLSIRNKYVISGYMLDGSASRFYVIDFEKKSVEKYFTLKINGFDFKEKASGVVSSGGTMWTVSNNALGGYLYRFELNDVINCENAEAIDIIDYYKVDNNADFILERDGILWIGENYIEGETSNASNHHIETRSGEKNHAIVYGYLIDEGMAYGLSTVSSKNGRDPLPTKALSIRANAKGMSFTSAGDIVISTSKGLADSKFYYYENVLKEQNHTSVKIGFNSIPTWYLDDKCLTKETSAPCLAQEITIVDSRAYILFSSGSNNISAFAKNKIKSVYSVDEHYLKV